LKLFACPRTIPAKSKQTANNFSAVFIDRPPDSHFG
jgi:hypothetical protein